MSIVMENLHHIFVDECGTSNLNSSSNSVSHLFIMVAIYVEDHALEQIKTKLEEISGELCSGAEIKSSKIGTKHQRRIKFLEKIQLLPFKYRALVVNKSVINKSSGLQYKKSFYKFMARLLYEDMLKSGLAIRIYADEIGSQEFMDSFIKYFKNKGIPDLFINYEFEFKNSSTERIIQLADLVAGSLSYCFDDAKQCEFSSKFRELLRTKEIAIRSWPYQKNQVPVINSGNKDEFIKITLSNNAIEFINNYSGENASTKNKIQSLVVEKLFFARTINDTDDQDIYSDQLIKEIAAEGYDSLKKQQLASQVIGPIRDKGIVIVGSQKGYRLALSMGDVCEYLNHDIKIIEPMLFRVSKAKQALHGENIFKEKIYNNLKNLVEVFEENLLDSLTKNMDI